jgi:hypothetical protein
MSDNEDEEDGRLSPFYINKMPHALGFGPHHLFISADIPSSVRKEVYNAYILGYLF